MSANFTVYRRGAAAFTIESREQGRVRKATSAKYVSKLMNDESVSLTVLSSVTLDFRLRDYIIYKGKPYMLNQMPEVSVDSSKLYTYNVRFEGAMYELGRVAFLLDNAFGYDYYGTIADFGRLIVGNMNRVNRYVVWEEYSQATATTHIARQSGVTADGKVIWGNLNGDDPNAQRWDHGFTSWIMTDDTNPAPNSNPIGSIRASDTPPVIKSVHEWKLDFPKSAANPPSYPQPVYYVPDNIPDHDIHWPDPANPAESQYISAEDYQSIAMSNERTEYYDYIPDPDNPQDTIPSKKAAYSVTSISAHTPVPTPGRECQSIGDIETVTNGFSYAVVKRTYNYVIEGGAGRWVLYDTSTSWHSRTYHITYTGTGTQGTTWQMQNVTPQSGAATNDDFETVENLLSYDSHSCLAVLNDICTQWDGWEWYIDGEECTHYKGEMLVNATIHMRLKNENKTGVVHNMDFGRKGGLSVIKRKYADGSNMPSRVYFYGGGQNLPQYYRNTRLCLPNAGKDGSYIDLTCIHGFQLPEATANRTCEEVKVFDDIYPANEPLVIGSGWGVTIASETVGAKIRRYLQLTIPKAEFFDLTAKWTLNGDNAGHFIRTRVISESDYPDYFEWLKWKGETDVFDTSTNSSPTRVRYWNYYVNEHVSKYLTGGESPVFTFQTGEIAGYSLAVHDFSLQTINRNEYWVINLNTVKEDNSEADTTTDESHKYVPNADICAVQGDKFIIEDINMPVSYTYYKDGTATDRSAENSLWRAAMDYVNSLSEKIDHEIEVSRDYASGHGFSPSVRDSVCFGDVTADGSAVTKRITELDLDLVDGYSYKLVISNGTASSGVRRIKRLISSVTNTNPRQI